LAIYGRGGTITAKEGTVMETVALSESAVAALRFRVKGWRWKVNDRNRAAFQELVAAGIMEPDGEDFRFTEAGWERREEILAEQEDRIERERYEPPDASHLSQAARELLRTCVVTEYPDGDETNRPAYRELVKARIMIPMGSFTQGDECVFRFTYWGWRRRFEFAEMDCPKDVP
jgi:hypothetical protein